MLLLAVLSASFSIAFDSKDDIFARENEIAILNVVFTSDFSPHSDLVLNSLHIYTVRDLDNH